MRHRHIDPATERGWFLRRAFLLALLTAAIAWAAWYAPWTRRGVDVRVDLVGHAAMPGSTPTAATAPAASEQDPGSGPAVAAPSARERR